MLKKALRAFAFFLTLLPGLASADSNPAPVLAPAVTTDSWTKHLPGLDDFYVSDFTTVNGPNLGHINSYTVDHSGHVGKQAMFLDNEITAAYLINKESTIGIGPTIRFNYTPVMGKGFEWNDVGLKFIDYKAFTTRHFRAAFNLFLLAPTAAWSKAAGMRYSIKSTPFFWFEIPDTNFVVGSWSEIKDYVGVNYGTQLKLCYLPYVNYKVNKHLALNLLYEEEYHHDVGKHGFTRYKSDIQPGMVITVNHNLSINPYVAVYLDNKISKDAMGLGALVNARIL
jgi:hypothetical protein